MPTPTVLIVEDNAVSSGVLVELFKRYNIAATAVETLNAALELNKKHPRDLVALDLELPDSPDTRKTLQVAKEGAFGPSKIAVVTGSGDLETEAMAKASGLVYIPKSAPNGSVFTELMRCLNLVDADDHLIQPPNE